MPYDFRSDTIQSDGPPQDMRPFHQKLVDMLMMRGSPQDIILESEGMVDPRLDTNPPAQFTPAVWAVQDEQRRKAFQNAQKTALGTDPALAGLRRFGQ
jgi:hypothetical protein